MAKLLSILLQRSDPGYPWGFMVRGGYQDRAPLTIDQVTPGTLAAQYLAPGDTILQIEKVDTRQLWPSQVEALICRPNKSLDLLVLKGPGAHTFPATPAPPDRRTQFFSSGSGSGSSSSGGRDLRSRKQHFWERISSEKPDICREGFTRLGTGGDSIFKDRQSRLDHWRRCQSEERSNSRFEDNYSSLFSDEEKSDSSRSERIQSVWSPTPTNRLKKQTSDYWSRDEDKKVYDERQGDVTFWEMSSDKISEPRTQRSGSLHKPYKRHNSDFSHGYSSLSSEHASTPKSNYTPTDSPELNEAFMKKPSDFYRDNNFRDHQGGVRFESLTSPRNFDGVWKNSNMSSKTEFKTTTSISEKSYSTAEGAKSFETYEHLNKRKETEKTSKTVDGGKEEVVEKTKKNKEYILANKDDINGQPKETKKVINDFKVIERIVDGDNEICNKVKERSEETTNSSTPVNFYDNVQQQGVAADPTIQRAEWCGHSVNRQNKVDVVQNGDSGSAKEDTDASSMSFSPLMDSDFSHRRWANSTPFMETDFIYQEQEPLAKNYFEVDIRSPVETQMVYSSTEEILRRQSSQISGGGSPVTVTPPGDVQVAPPPPPPPCPPAPPPPPPPGLAGSIPAVRLSTEIPDKRRSAYEPPAAIQNAMMTKDKKPFTYTPGGLDLSEIRSPRMARRISRNANAPDLAPAPSQPRPSPLSNQPLPPSALAAMQPQIAVAVLPQGAGVSQLHHVTPGGHHSGPPPPPPPPQPKMHPVSPPAQMQNMPSPPPQPTMVQPPSPQKVPQPPSPQRVMNRQPSPPPMAVPKLQPQHRHTKSEPQSTPGSIYVPPIEPQQQQQPRSQLGSLYIPPIAPPEPQKPQSPVSQLNKAPTPWMSRQNQQPQKEVPSWANRESVQSPSVQQQNQAQNQYQNQPQTRIIPIQIEGREQSQPNTRIIPIQLEKTPSPQHTPEQPNYSPQHYQQPPQYQPQQQYQQQSPQYHQQQQYQQPPQYQQQQQYQHQQPHYQQQQSYEQQQNPGRQTPKWMNQQPVYVHNKFNSGSQSPAPTEQNHGESQPGWRHSQSNGTMQSPGPVQSRSFKVLEKITGTDNGGADQSDAPYNSQGVPLSQLRKLQLSEDDRALMNKVKSQVDDETYLHNESDPRYRGSAIPSRAFRILQTMTDGAGDDSDVPRAYSPVQVGQNRSAANRTPQPDAPQQYVPPSEQQVQEPRKYTGGAIPSRSFRMLQAMTAGSETDRPGESEF